MITHWVISLIKSAFVKGFYSRAQALNELVKEGMDKDYAQDLVKGWKK